MHSKLSAPGETVPITRPPSRIRGITCLPAFLILLVSLLVSASPGFAQTFLSSLTGITGPTFVAIDNAHPAGTTWLYVSEHGAADNTGTGGGRILKYNLTTGSTTPTVIATAGNADGQFRSPDAILVDSATGDLFISDRYLNRIQRITNTGTFVMKWGSSTAGAPDEMHGPVGLARDGTGAIYVTEHGDANGAGVPGNVVAKYTIVGTTATRVWRNGNGFNVPYGVAIAGSSLLISDGFNERLQAWDPSTGTPTGSLSLPGVIPLGLYVDSGGSVWIAESSGNGTGAIQRFEKRTAAGVLQSSFGSAGTGAGQFMLPFDMVIDAATNRAYASDYSNNRVQVWDLTPAAPAAPVISSATTASATVGTAFSYQITASNSPTSYGATALAGTGLSVNTSTGAITGTPTTAGTITSTISATNATGTGSATLTITVAAGGGGGDTTRPSVQDFAIDLSTATATTASFVVTFSEPVTGVDASDFQLNAISGASATITGVTATSSTVYRLNFNYSGASGSIQGAIRTSATGIVDAATNAFVGFGKTASDPVSVNAAPPADMTPPTVSSFTFGTPSGSTVPFTLTFSEAVTGVTSDDIFVTTSGSATGTVGAVTGSGTTWTGSVTVGGTGTVQLTAIGGVTANVRDATTHWFGGGGNPSTTALSVGGGGGAAPVISSATTASATVGTAFSYQITASNSPTSYGATGLTGTGLSVNTATGAITGTPTTAGTITSTISATNATGTGSATLTITVAAGGGGGAAPVISSATTASATVGTAFSYQITASNSPTSYGATGLTGTGLSVNTTTGAITGTPTTAGTITSTISATNATGTGSATLTITVAAGGGGGAAPVVSSAGTASATVGAAFSYQITASNSPTSYGATGLTGTGLSVNTTTGAITGTPTAAGTITSTISATNATGTGTKTLTITVSLPGAPVISSAGTASGNVGAAFSYQITASNSPTSYGATGFPTNGLSFNATTGVISGTPTAAGTISTTVSATNSGGTGSKALTITISVGPPPVITSGLGAMVQAGAQFAYTITASNSPTAFAATNLPAGLIFTSPSISGSVATPGTYNIGISASNTFGTDTKTLVLTVTSAPAGGGGGGGGGPVGGGGGGGGGGGLSLPQTVAFAPPSEMAVGQTIALSATTSAGQSVAFTLITGNAILAGNLLTANGIGSVVVRASTDSNGIYQAASTDATINVKNKQTIAFNSPVSAIVINTPVTLSATSSAGLPITYTLLLGNATLSGNVLTPTGLGEIVVRAASAGNATTAGASVDVNFGSPQKAAQSINFAALTDMTTAAGPITLATTTDAGMAVTYAVSGAAKLQGNTLVLTGAVGTVTVRATAPGNDLFNAADVTRSFAVRAIGQQVYLGTIGSDTFAVVVSLDNTKGVFVTRFAATGEALVAKFTINASGSFSTSGISSLTSAGEGPGGPAVAALVARTISGTVVNGTVSGSIAELGTNFSASVSPATGSTASIEGVYIASIPGSASGDTYLVVGPAGQAYAVAITPFGVTSGTGTVSSAGEFSITTANGGSIAGAINAGDGTIRGTLTNGTATAALVGLSEGASRTDRIINLSSRLRTSADASRMMIAGFVVVGNEPKQMLVRAIGPSLSAFGVQGALANPRLQIYNSSGALVAENEDWGNNAAVAAAATSVGAFALDPASRDAALLVTLDPGAYTAQVITNGGTGVALVEVYDTASAASGSRQLINISTRGFVDTGDGNLIAGFVVSGNAPKRVLIRGIGPSLTQFGVQGAVANPTLKLYAAGSTQVIAQNDDWSTAQPIDSSQAAATAAELSAAFTAAGAFPLSASSRDAAIVITLMPGAYTAVVGDASNGTGAGLVEVYEISNQ